MPRSFLLDIRVFSLCLFRWRTMGDHFWAFVYNISSVSSTISNFLCKHKPHLLELGLHNNYVSQKNGNLVSKDGKIWVKKLGRSETKMWNTIVKFGKDCFLTEQWLFTEQKEIIHVNHFKNRKRLHKTKVVVEIWMRHSHLSLTISHLRLEFHLPILTIFKSLILHIH